MDISHFKHTLLETQGDYENAQLLLEHMNKRKFWQLLFTSAKNKYLAEWVNLKTPKLQDPKFNWWTKFYWIMHGLTDFPLCPFYDCEFNCEICPGCRPQMNVSSFEHGYTRACSIKCKQMQKKKQQKNEETILKNYGSKNFFSSDVGKAIKKDWCEKHNVTNPFQLESIKEKSKKTRKEHFGCEYTMQSKEKQELAKEHYLEKTGFEHQFKNPEIKKQIQNSLKDREDIYLKRKLGNRKRRYKNFLNNAYIEPKFSKEIFLNLTYETQYTTILSWKCKKCGEIFDGYLDQNFSSRKGIPIRCPKCFPLDKSISDSEKEIVDFLKNISNDEIIENDRSLIAPLELDIYIPNKKLAIEFDGLFWHNDEIKSPNYHLNKTNLCEKLGIQLIHIFENEWILKQDIVKSRLKNLLGVYDKTIYARCCEIKPVASGESKDFQDKNHIQGSVNAGVSLGLYFDDELISLMTFGKCRFNKNYEYELLRFCNKLGYHIPGAASKLLKYFERNYNPKSLISYADRRWSQGKVYEKLGFKLDHISGPNYWYFKNLNLESRVKYQKHKLKNILENFDENKSEVENMKDNGYNRIFDCGNLVYVKEYHEI